MRFHQGIVSLKNFQKHTKTYLCYNFDILFLNLSDTILIYHSVLFVLSSNQQSLLNEFLNEKDSEGPYISVQTPPNDNASESPIHENSVPMVAQPTEKDVVSYRY